MPHFFARSGKNSMCSGSYSEVLQPHILKKFMRSKKYPIVTIPKSQLSSHSQLSVFSIFISQLFLPPIFILLFNSLFPSFPFDRYSSSPGSLKCQLAKFIYNFIYFEVTSLHIPISQRLLGYSRSVDRALRTEQSVRNFQTKSETKPRTTQVNVLLGMLKTFTNEFLYI